MDGSSEPIALFMSAKCLSVRAVHGGLSSRAVNIIFEQIGRWHNGPGDRAASPAVPAAAPRSRFSRTFDSTLAVLGGVAGGIHQETEELGWRIGQEWGAGRGWRIPVGPGGPEFSSDGGERVAEGGF